MRKSLNFLFLCVCLFLISCSEDGGFVQSLADREESAENVVKPEAFPDSVVVGEKDEDESVISFSHSSGFYDSEFYLELQFSGEGKIVYTTDSKTIVEYSKPILIKDATEQPNVYSMIEDISRGYAEGVYKLPQYNVDKCTVVKACIKYADGTYSPVQTRVYFVGLKGRDSVEGIGICSISMNPDYLFDYEIGIYVLGKCFADSPGYKYWHWANGNFRQKGREWERKASIQFFDKNGSLQVSQPCGVRVKGGGSRGRAQKSFNIYARKDYDGYNKFKYDFFGTKYKAKKLTLFSGGDDDVSKSLDYTANEACNDKNCEKVNFSTFHFVPYALFLNGEYWGMYWLTEAYDDKYLEETYKLDSDDVIMIKSGEVEEGNDDDINLWKDARSFLANSDMTVAQNYEAANELIDVDSFIQYYATQIYIGRYNDWGNGNSNSGAWRSRAKDAGYNDGRWRWMLFDVNSGSMEQHLQTANTLYFDCIKRLINSDAIFASLVKNDDFRNKLKTEILYNSTNRFAANKMEGLINAFVSSYYGNLEESCSRWYGYRSTRYLGIRSAFENRKSFFNGRSDAVAQYMADNLE